MKKVNSLILIAVIAVLGLCIGGNAYATPTTTFFTSASCDIQPYGVVHFGIDNYFTVGRTKERGALPTDLGLTVGVLPFEKIQLEVGFDWLEPTTDPLYFNAKLGTPEGSIFAGSPALNLGVFNVGTDSKTTDGDGRTDYDIVDVIVAKTLPAGFGRIHAGAYYGNGKTLVNRFGDKANTGFMVGWDKGYVSVKDAEGEYSKWVMAADWASGKNAIGGGGFGVARFFTRNVSLLTGPVWFNEPQVASANGDAKWVWSTQLDINF